MQKKCMPVVFVNSLTLVSGTGKLAEEIRLSAEKFYTRHLTKDYKKARPILGHPNLSGNIECDA